jgi:hypothetical protein
VHRVCAFNVEWLEWGGLADGGLDRVAAIDDVWHVEGDETDETSIGAGCAGASALGSV